MAEQSATSETNKHPSRSVRPQWDSSSDHVDTSRESVKEKLRRVASHASKNLRAAQRDLQERKIRQGMDERLARPPAKSKSIVTESMTSMEEIEDLLLESDRVLSEARDILAQHSRDYQSSISSR